jgi:hypothetical protein
MTTGKPATRSMFILYIDLPKRRTRDLIAGPPGPQRRLHPMKSLHEMLIDVTLNLAVTDLPLSF